MFVAFGEVHEKIQSRAAARTRQGARAKVKAVDVVRWVIDETRLTMNEAIPLWANQGLYYQLPLKAWETYATTSDRYAFVTSLLEQESQPLSELYGYSAKPGLLAELHATPGGLANQREEDLGVVFAVW